MFDSCITIFSSDKLQVYRGVDSSGSLLTELTGYRLPLPIQATGDADGGLFLRFVSGERDRRGGFRISYDVKGYNICLSIIISLLFLSFIV